MTDLTTTLSMAMTVMMVPISQGVAAMANGRNPRRDKRLKVRVDGWVVAEPPVVDGDEWDDHQQSQSDNLG
ncbi:hypothetical protein PNOK_0005100 [Pyrrhoderma noxium]|uniref:Uncharacterized protein n=1 Tax=Pyrrhoderma noxium TaxID=2282107 RepID=A0A286UTV4_9AGAM|nr:hypothetical protein PNOK_0005100 [Pyrrhoderma noxium]